MTTKPSNPVQQLDRTELKTFAQRVMNDMATTLHGALSYIGDKLGLFQALAEIGPATVEEIASKTGYQQRYLREWLNGMVAADYITYDSATLKYSISAERAAVLADEECLYFMGGVIQEIAPALTVANTVAQSFKSGGGVSQDSYMPEMFESIDRITMPWYKHLLVQKWIPSMPHVQQMLEKGCDVLDVGCGSGRALIALAKAFPNSRFTGYDFYEPSLQMARQKAQQAGVADRIQFVARDASDIPEKAFDLVTTFDVIHDSPQPDALLKAIRAGLRDGGVYFVLETNAKDDVNDNRTPEGKLLYSISLLYCMTTSLAHGGAGLGAAMGINHFKRLAQAAGFKKVEKLPIEGPLYVLFECSN